MVWRMRRGGCRLLWRCLGGLAGGLAARWLIRRHWAELDVRAGNLRRRTFHTVLCRVICRVETFVSRMNIVS